MAVRPSAGRLERFSHCLIDVLPLVVMLSERTLEVKPHVCGRQLSLMKVGAFSENKLEQWLVEINFALVIFRSLACACSCRSLAQTNDPLRESLTGGF